MLNITVAPITKWFGEGATEAEHPCGKVTEARKEELGDSHAPEYGRCLPGYSRRNKNWNGMWKDYDEPICSTDGQEPNCEGTQCDSRPPEWGKGGGPMWKDCRGVALDRDPEKIHTYVARVVIS